MHGLYKCNLNAFKYNIQSILIMHEIDLAHISITYNSFTSSHSRDLKWKYEQYGGNRILNFANGRARDRRGMPISRHFLFALMPVAQFWEAGISLGMPHSHLWMPCPWSYIRSAHPTYSIYWYVYGCGDELKHTWAVIYLSKGIYNASFGGVVMKKCDCAHVIVFARVIRILLNCLFVELLNIVVNNLSNFKTIHYR